MRFAVASLVAIMVGAVSAATPAKVSVTECDKEFSHWMVQHGKSYDASELFARFKTFCSNLDSINQFNTQSKQSFKKSVNAFAAHTAEEFKAMQGFKQTGSADRDIQLLSTVRAPSTVDWTTQGAVTDIKNQGQCGSCWAFSTTGSVEGRWKIAGNPLVSLSEQQVMDCSTPFGNQGCNGGLMDNAFRWIINNSGITSEANDPYASGSGVDPYAGKCTTYPSIAKIRSYKDVVATEAQLMAAVAEGPVSVAIEADQLCFQFYGGGVLAASSCNCGKNLDHGVLVVGYGTDAATGLDYWKVKNSWGLSWGEAGYIRLQRGAGVPAGGMCGILTSASYPIV